MTKINIKKSKTVTTIMATLLIGLMLLSPMTVSPNVNASPVKEDCTKKISNAMHSKASSLDKKKAISLAFTNNDVKSKIQNHNSQSAVIFNTWNLDLVNCNAVWKDVNVGYMLNDENGHEKNIVVTLDPSLTTIIGVNSYMGARYYANVTTTNWSGYQLGNGYNVTQAHLSTNIPQISQPIISNYSCVPTTGKTPGCDLAIWTGLEDQTGTYIAQGGSDGNLTCNNTSCTSPTYNYFLWFEFLPNPSFTCHNGAISYNDAITANITLASKVGNFWFLQYINPRYYRWLRL